VKVDTVLQGKRVHNPEIRSQTSVIDPECPTETARLMLQHRLVTYGMQSIFPERSCVDGIDSLLDVGCGPGCWALDMAHTYPDVSVVGIDISTTMIAYAQAQAIAQRLENVAFVVMDAFRPLDFEIGTFDLVNVRFAIGFVPRSKWPAFLEHCCAVLRKGGVLRLTEAEVVGLTNSRMVEQMHGWAAQMLHRKGYGFSPDGSHLGILPMLGQFLQDVGCDEYCFLPHLLNFSVGTSLHVYQYQNYMVWPQLLKSTLLKTLFISEEVFDHTYECMMDEMQRPSFRGLWNVMTVWGKVP